MATTFRSDYALETNLADDDTIPFARDGVTVVRMHGSVTETQCDQQWLKYDQTRNFDDLGDVWADYSSEWAVYLSGAQVAGPFETLSEANATAEAVHDYAQHTQRRAN